MGTEVEKRDEVLKEAIYQYQEGAITFVELAYWALTHILPEEQKVQDEIEAELAAIFQAEKTLTATS